MDYDYKANFYVINLVNAKGAPDPSLKKGVTLYTKIGNAGAQTSTALALAKDGLPWGSVPQNPPNGAEIRITSDTLFRLEFSTAGKTYGATDSEWHVLDFPSEKPSGDFLVVISGWVDSPSWGIMKLAMPNEGERWTAGQ